MSDKTNVIAETAWHHEGDYDFMHELITLLAQKTKCDFIKFHVTLDCDRYMGSSHPGYKQLKKWMLSPAQWKSLIDLAQSHDKQQMFLVNDVESLEMVLSYRPQLIELHSVSLTDLSLLDAVKSNLDEWQTIVLGVGGTRITDIDNIVSFLNRSNLLLMHGFQNYPTVIESINFNKVRSVMRLYPEFKHGYADHTAWDHPDTILVTLFGAALGVDYIEKHVSHKYGTERCDWNAAISIDMFNELIAKIDLLEKANGNGRLALNPGERAYSQMGHMRKVPVARQCINRGEKLSHEKFTYLRVDGTTDLSLEDILGMNDKSAARRIAAGDIFMRDDLGDSIG